MQNRQQAQNIDVNQARANMQQVMDVWPTMIAMINGMVTHAEQAGFSRRVATAVALNQIGVPVALTVNDLD